MVNELSILNSEALTEYPCLICGGLTRHRHAYSDSADKKVAICKECCNHGCGSIHGMIDLQARVYHCSSCKKDLPADKCGKVLDKRICPDCMNAVEPLREKL